jgi:hypothetical protein
MHVLQSVLMFLGSIILLLIAVLSVLRDLIARAWHPVEFPSGEADKIYRDLDRTMEAERSLEYPPR